MRKSLSIIIKNERTERVRICTPPKIAKNNWTVAANRRNLFDTIAKNLGIEKQSDWYQFTGAQISQQGAAKLIKNNYNSSLFYAIQHVYPEFDWNPLLFHQLPHNYLRKQDNHRLIFDRIAEELQIEVQEDWYKVTARDLHERGARGLLNHYYNDSYVTALQMIYPQFTWNKQLFSSSKSEDNSLSEQTKLKHKTLFDKIGNELNIQTQTDWYNVSIEKLHEMGAGGAIKYHYNNSIIQVLQEIYPQYEWHPWLFVKLPNKYFDSKQNQLACIKWIEEQLGINEKPEWLKVSRETVKSIGGSSILYHYRNSLIATLKGVYDDYDWSAAIILSDGQKNTYEMLRSLFDTEILINHKIKGEDGSVHELDIYIPSLSIAFEYQGLVHYDPNYYTGSASEVKGRESLKRQHCDKNGITLINIPFWWDNSLESIVSTIQKHRPDLNI